MCNYTWSVTTGLMYLVRSIVLLSRFLESEDYCLLLFVCQALDGVLFSSSECDEGVVLDNDSDDDVMIVAVEGESDIRVEQIISVLKGNIHYPCSPLVSFLCSWLVLALYTVVRKLLFCRSGTL